MEIREKRLNWPDIAKGIGILIVVIGHTDILPTSLQQWIFSFHVPVFFLISGYFFKKYPVNVFAYKKFKTLLKPYLFYASLFFVIDILLNSNGFDILGRIIEIGLGRYNALWFLIALLVCEVLFYGICCISENKKAIACFVVVFWLIGEALLYFNIDLPFRILNALMMMPFFCAGFLLKECKAVERIKTVKQKWLALAIVTVTNIAFCYLNVFCDVRTNVYGNPLFFYLAASAGSMIIVLISVIIRKNSVLEYIGRNSLCIFALNTYIPSRLAMLGGIFLNGIVRKGIAIFLLGVAVVFDENRKKGVFKRMRKNEN